MVAYYYAQWRAAYRNGSITKSAPTLHRPSSSNTVDRGMAMLQTLQTGAIASMSESLRAVSETDCIVSIGGLRL